jgi:hypothetical protein
VVVKKCGTEESQDFFVADADKLLALLPQAFNCNGLLRNRLNQVVGDASYPLEEGEVLTWHPGTAQGIGARHIPHTCLPALMCAPLPCCAPTAAAAAQPQPGVCGSGWGRVLPHLLPTCSFHMLRTGATEGDPGTGGCRCGVPWSLLLKKL